MNNLQKDYIRYLTEYLSYRSISTDSSYKSQIKALIEWLMTAFKNHGFSVQELIGKECNPIIFASYTHDLSLKTVLIYGHYDVQPADINDGWQSDPWELTERDGRLFARGVVDNKGQLMIHIATIFDLIKSGKLKYNVKFLIEGNEETSNPDLAEIMIKNKNTMSCDYVLVSDGEITSDRPTIDASLRGGFNARLTITTGKNALHSGIYGGAVPNALNELSKFLSKLYTPENKVSYEAFYELVDEIISEQAEGNKSLFSSEEEIIELAGVKKLMSEPDTDFFTQTGLRPTIQITGIKGGYIGDGFANIVPHTAEARLNFRIVASQKASEVAEAFKLYVASNMPDYIDYNLEFSGLHNPVKLDTQNGMFKHVEKLLYEIYKKPVVKKNVGGAIPFISDVKEELGIDTLSVSLANADCNMHGVDENFKIELIKKGLKFSKEFFSDK